MSGRQSISLRSRRRSERRARFTSLHYSLCKGPGIEALFREVSYGLDMLLDQLVYLLPDEDDGKGASIFIRAGASPSDRTLIDE